MTKYLVVSDSSTLILMVKAGFIELAIKKMSVLIPTTVFEESVVRGKETGRWDAFKVENLVREKLIQVKKPSSKNL